MGRSISVALLPSLITPHADVRAGCAVVIDVLRATSVMATAGRAGIRQITTCEDINTAFALAAAADERPLLCGERQCKPIDGFDLGNSPAEYSPEAAGGRDMVLTTTNGTKAIMAVIDSRRLMVSSFLNLDATVAAIADEEQLQLVCAGTEGHVSYEDVLLAGAIVDRLDSKASLGDRDNIDDSARLAWNAWKQTQTTHTPLANTLRQSLGGRNLLRVGYQQDIDRCAEVSAIDGIVQRVERGKPVFRYVTKTGSGVNRRNGPWGALHD